MKNKFLQISLIAFLMISASVTYPNVKEYYITCNPDEFTAIYKDAFTDTYIPVTLTYNGKTWTDLRMRIRGDDTRWYPKKSLKVKFDGELFENGRDVLNFNAEYEDPTYLCQYLSSLTFRTLGYPCYETEHARLYLNGKFLGLYLRIENVDSDFLKSEGLDPSGNLYKATEDDASLSIYDDIRKLWEKKTNEAGSWNDLQELIDSLFYVPDNEYYEFAKRTFDYDKMIEIIAVNLLTSHGSTYYHNYFMYHDIFQTNKWMMLPWDMDKTFSMYGYNYPYHRSSSYSSPDNPFLERALLCEPVFNDIRARINGLKDEMFNSEFFEPIIDSLIPDLIKSVAEDETDNVTDTTKWLKNTEGIKKYLRERYNVLQYQFDNWPRSFKVEPTLGFYYDSVKFVWHPSYHPQAKEITYDFYFGSSEFLDDTSKTTIIRDIKDTFYVKTDLPVDGTYWWKVTACDGSECVDGFNYPNPIKIKKPTELPCTISSDMTLTKENSPYKLNCNLVISSKLNLEKGVILLVSKDKKITVNGSLIVNGTFEEPVKIEPSFFGESLDKIEIINGSLTASNTLIQDCPIAGTNANVIFDSVTIVKKFKDLTDVKTYFHIIGGTVSFKNSFMKIDSTCEGLIFKELSYSIVHNCVFHNTYDAIEYISVNNGIITNNTVINAYDDGIDINNCDRNIISGNKIYNVFDKGISVGNEEIGTSIDVLISKNIIVNCYTGIAVKDGSNAMISNNTLYKNMIGIHLFEKFAGLKGGHGIIENTIISDSQNSIISDSFSEFNISYSLCTGTLYEGVGNIFSEPKFMADYNYDFRLLPDSPCIDAGNPESTFDSDGTIADIGAIFYDQKIPKVVINEINYKSSNYVNPGDWVELYNADSNDVDLSGWILKDSDDSHAFIFEKGTILKSGDYLVINQNYKNFKNVFEAIDNVTGETGFGLSSNGELVRLYNSNMIIIDSVEYGGTSPWPSAANGDGPTLELINPEYDNTKPWNWKSSKNYGTPGWKNSIYEDSSSTFVYDFDVIEFVSVFPNPTKEDINFVVNLSENINYDIRIYNLLGEQINIVPINFIKLDRVYVISFDTRILSPGYYLLYISNGIKSKSKSFFKAK